MKNTFAYWASGKFITSVKMFVEQGGEKKKLFWSQIGFQVVNFLAESFEAKTQTYPTRCRVVAQPYLLDRAQVCLKTINLVLSRLVNLPLIRMT